MKVARILFPIRSLGPGDRLCLWVCGCKRRCPQCSNPELQYADPAKEIDMRALISLIEPQLSFADGVTVTGGEPFDQSAELAELIEAAREHTRDILVFTGYTRRQLEERRDAATDRILDTIAVLIDGEYIDALNQGDALRGSSNQRIHYLRPDAQEAYEAYLRGGRVVQNVATASGVYSIGIHGKGFASGIKTALSTAPEAGPAPSDIGERRA